MELYLIRHGIAADPAEYRTDEERPLTDRGRQKTAQVAQRLYDLGIRFDLILSSPLVRAQQTAALLQQAHLSEQVEVFAPLAPGGNIQAWVDWRSTSHYNQEGSCLALVGHQPNLGNWAEILLWGSPNAKLVVKKAGIVGLNLPSQENPIGKSELFLLAAPKWLL
jgi:phosphohistidine phosphatase